MKKDENSFNPCVVYLVWGERAVEQVFHTVRNSPGIAKYKKVIITDKETKVPETSDFEVRRVDFALPAASYARKSEFWKVLPEGHSSYAYFDSDVWVIGDIDYAFEKAEKHGFALVQSNSYLLDQFKRFHQVLEKEGLSAQGLAQYNAGVIFFSGSEESLEVLKLWEKLCEKYLLQPEYLRMLDQPFLSLALELRGLSPHTLIRNFNYRPNRDSVIGPIRIWHRTEPPPANINDQSKSWRRYDAKTKQMVPLVRKTLGRRLSDAVIRWGSALLGRHRKADR